MLEMQEMNTYVQRNILNKNCLTLFNEVNEIWHIKLTYVPNLLCALCIGATLAG